MSSKGKTKKPTVSSADADDDYYVETNQGDDHGDHGGSDHGNDDDS